MAEKKKRRVLTAEEKIAKLEAEAAQLREKMEAKRIAQREAKRDERDRLVKRIADLQVKVDAIDSEYPELSDNESTEV